MRRIGSWVALGIGMFITVGLLTAKPGFADPTCDLKTLKGRYLFSLPGPLLPPAFGVTAPTPSAAAGFHIFNGDGTGKDILTFVAGDNTVLVNFEADFTYSVSSDCTGSITQPPPGPSFS